MRNYIPSPSYRICHMNNSVPVKSCPERLQKAQVALGEIMPFRDRHKNWDCNESTCKRDIFLEMPETSPRELERGQWNVVLVHFPSQAPNLVLPSSKCRLSTLRPQQAKDRKNIL